MITMNKLKAKLKNRVPAAGAGPIATLELDSAETAARALFGLEDYFGQDDRRKAVKLVLGDGMSGYLHRADLLQLISLTTRGLGESDGMSLPGDITDVTLIELCCPVRGCKHRLLVTRFDANDPPKCKAHPKSKMKPCHET